MAAHPGEDIAATLFADVHYFYGPPTAKPPHHRFDKGSYVYLYENASQRRARIEIANNAGTPDQDAFDGLLDNVQVDYDHAHPTLVTLTIDAFTPPTSTSTTPPPPDTDEWRLPTFDPRNEAKYLYRLHAFDIYLWTAADAQLFLSTVQRVLPSQHVRISGEPPATAPAAHAQAMSPIVQQLEHVAISSPPHQAAEPSFPGPPTAPPSFPGPPPSSPPQAQTFTPLAYNPAAPAAPEAIAHREKTPPPPDAATNPLTAAALDHAQQPYAPAQPQPQQQQQQQSQQQSQQQAQPQPLGSNSYFPGPPSAAAGLYAPGSTPAASPAGYTPQAQQYQSQQPQQPQQQYAGSAAPVAPAGGEYGIHQQVYQPGAGEAAVKKPAEGGAHKLGLGQNAARLEKGVTGFLRKFEKKYA